MTSHIDKAISLRGESITFVVSSTYQLLMSHVLLESFRCAKKRYLVVSDLLGDYEGVTAKVRDLAVWDEIVVVRYHTWQKNSKAVFSKINEHWHLKNEIDKIVQKLDCRDVCVFSHGDPVAVLFECSEYIQQKFLGEDGSFPYYSGVGSYDSRPNFTKALSVEKNFIKRLGLVARYMVKKLFAKHLLVDHCTRIDRIVLAKPHLLKDKNDKNLPPIVEADLSNEGLEFAFNNLSKIYDYKAGENNAYSDVDIVFFDSELYLNNDFDQRKQVTFIVNFLSKFNGKKILIKLSPLINQERDNYFFDFTKHLDNIVIDKKNAKIPWEVVYFNNLDHLSECVFISQRCTACFSPYLLFGKKTEIINIGSDILSHDVYPDFVIQDTLLYEEFLSTFK